jgi:multicomponent Na+:H+ antiporter subunit E
VSATEALAPNELSGLLGRAAGYFGFWLIIAGVQPIDMVVGAMAAVLAAHVSLRLLPMGHWRFRPVALTSLILRFLRQCIVAGVNVAWRALDPRMPLRPGFIGYRPSLPPGPNRNAFCTMASLLPGTLPCGADDSGDLVIHCLDVDQPVAEQYAAEEAFFMNALLDTPRHG